MVNLDKEEKKVFLKKQIKDTNNNETFSNDIYTNEVSPLQYNNIFHKIFATIMFLIGGITFYYINHAFISTQVDDSSITIRLIDFVIFIILFFLLSEVWNIGNKTELNIKVLMQIKEHIVGKINTGIGCLVSLVLFVLLVLIPFFISLFFLQDKYLSGFIFYIPVLIFNLLLPLSMFDLNFNKKGIEEVNIPDTYISNSFIYKGNQFRITSIGNNVFKDCINLKHVEIPNTITKIKNNAFYGCTSLENLVIPYCVTKIGENAFAGVKNINISEAQKTLANYPWGAKKVNGEEP